MEKFYDRRVILFDKWLHPKGYRLAVLFLLNLLLCFGSGALVYATGGTKFVYAHSMYIPILLAAFFFRFPGGIFAGLIGGLILGPFMPIDVSTGQMQSTINWIYRLVMFVLIGGFAGFITKSLDIQIGKFKWLAFHNPDTGFKNRNYLMSEMGKVIVENGSTSEYAIVISRIINYDGLVNTYGIDVTDLLIGQLIQRLKDSSTDVPVCQTLPSMLGILIKDTGPDNNENIIRIIDLLKAPVIYENVPVFIDLSTGISYYPKDGDNPAILLRKSVIAANSSYEYDIPIYEYDLDIDNLSSEKTSIVGWLSIALENHQFLLHYQPIIDLNSGKIFSMEALIRWQHPEKGLIPPAEFIHHLENTSLIYSVQKWVVETVIDQQHRWSEQGVFLPVAINISARGVNNPEWIDSLKQLYHQRKIESCPITLEITETAIMTKPVEVAFLFDQLRESGITLAIDDYGSGYSSLAYLRSLPVDYLKIDTEFIRHLSESVKDQEIVRATLSLAKALNLKVIAEGVETKETYDWLKSEHCNYAQGYFIARPMPANQVLAWLNEYQGIS